MWADPKTCTDCEKCIFSLYADISSDYEEYQWQCIHGEGQIKSIDYAKNESKPCNLPAGIWYSKALTNKPIEKTPNSSTNKTKINLHRMK